MLKTVDEKLAKRPACYRDADSPRRGSTTLKASLTGWWKGGHGSKSSTLGQNDSPKAFAFPGSTESVPLDPRGLIKILWKLTASYTDVIFDTGPNLSRN